ncbi:MAG: heme exporter protein CcmB, partial [Pseudomonadota bacterium]
LLSLGRAFETDFDDGSLEAIALGGQPLELVAAAKALAHWLTTAVPLALLAPLLGLMLNLSFELFAPLVITMLVGTPAISFLGGIGAALTLRAKRGGLLLALLVLPLYVPTLIYGITAISAVQVNVGSGFSPALMLLAAISLGAMALGPFATAAALRMQLQ